MSEIIGNRYQLVKKLGGGGMATVYLAVDNILNREVAIKILKPELANDPIALERFAREAKASARLIHPNIVETYDVGDSNDKHYIVMEYIKGYTLKKLIDIRGALPFKESIWIIKQLAYALLEAHKNGIIHRDIKSQNVLIKPDGTIKMADFGIAQTIADAQITSNDTIIGSVHYLAPEVTKGKPATLQSDIYSLGIVLFELLTGDVPFKGDSPVSIALQHVNKAIPSVRSFDSSIPQSVENIVIKATAKNLNNRYSDCAELINDLNECLKPNKINQKPLSFDSNKEGTFNLNIFDTPDDDYIKKEKNKATVTVTIIGIILVLIFSGAAVFGILYLNGAFKPNISIQTVKVPNLNGLTVIEADDVLIENGLVLDYQNITRVLTDDVPEGKIISFDPSEGTSISKGSKVKIVVSNGLYSVLKNYLNYDLYNLKNELSNSNIKAQFVPVENVDGTPGKIISQSINEGYKYDPNLPLDITFEYIKYKTIEIGFGQYKGKTIVEVSADLESKGVRFNLIEKESSYFTPEELDKYLPYTIVRIDPDEGSWYTQDADSCIIGYYYTKITNIGG